MTNVMILMSKQLEKSKVSPKYHYDSLSTKYLQDYIGLKTPKENLMD